MLKTIHNFRDFGDKTTTDGKHVKRGLLYRSGTLSNASKKDMAHLIELGIKTIVDLRTVKEHEKQPDRIPKNTNIEYIHIPIKVKKHNESGRIIQLFSLLFGEFRNLDYHEILKEANREFVTDFCQQFAQVIHLTAKPEKLPILLHCTGGKDRTGFASSLILHALGVSHDLVTADYLESNQYMEGLRKDAEHLLRFFACFGVKIEQFKPLLQVHPDYLESAYEQIRKTYKNVENYFSEGLGLTQDVRSALRASLLETG